MGAIRIDPNGKYQLKDWDKSPGTMIIIEREGNIFWINMKEMAKQDRMDEVHQVIDYMVHVVSGNENMLDLFAEAIQPFKLED